MKRTYVEKIKTKIGKKILIKGWAQTIRAQGSISFLVLRDITGCIQCIALQESVVERVGQIKMESVLEVYGIVKEEKQAPEGYEVEIIEIKILSEPKEALPIPVVEKSESETSLSKRLDYRWLDLRKPKNSLIFKIWTEMEKGFREYCTSHGYIEFIRPRPLLHQLNRDQSYLRLSISVEKLI